MKRITILITDDHTLVRESWAFILSNDPRFEVIAQCGSGEEAAEMSRQLHPDIVLMDINLPGINGIEATSLVRRYSPGSKIICVSMHTQPAYTRKIMQNGAMGYVTKSSSKEEMIEAIIEVYNNHKYVCNEIKNALSEQILGENEKNTGLNSLSAREMDIITHVRKGMSSKEIASLLAISVKTVEVHRYNILKKLNLKNVAALVNFVNNSQLAV